MGRVCMHCGRLHGEIRPEDDTLRRPGDSDLLMVQLARVTDLGHGRVVCGFCYQVHQDRPPVVDDGAAE